MTIAQKKPAYKPSKSRIINDNTAPLRVRIKRWVALAIILLLILGAILI